MLFTMRSPTDFLVFGCVLKSEAIEGHFQNRKSGLFVFELFNVLSAQRYFWLSKYQAKSGGGRNFEAECR